MNGHERDAFLQQVIEKFLRKYRKYEMYGDASQVVIESIYKSLSKVDFNRDRGQIYSFFNRRIRYNIKNMLIRRLKDQKMLRKYFETIRYTLVPKNNNDFMVEILIDKIKLLKYDVLPILLGKIPARRLAKLYGVSPCTLRRWVNRAKELVRRHFDIQSF